MAYLSAGCMATLYGNSRTISASHIRVVLMIGEVFSQYLQAVNYVRPLLYRFRHRLGSRLVLLVDRRELIYAIKRNVKSLVLIEIQSANTVKGRISGSGASHSGHTSMKFGYRRSLMLQEYSDTSLSFTKFSIVKQKRTRALYYTF